MFQSIERRAGLPLAIDPATGTLHLPETVSAGGTSHRSLAEMREFIRDATARADRDPIYTVYRALAHRGDEAAIRSSGLRYDITIIMPGAFAGERREFFHTAGHYHAPPAGQAGGALPEIYEVIAGRAYWLIQRPQPDDPAALEEVYIIEAGPGEKAVMPPGFGHISVNALAEPLVLANWIGESVAYDYAPYRRFHGGGYRLLEADGGAAIEFEKNPGYAIVPELVKLRPQELPAFGLFRSHPLYGLAHDPGRLRFLIGPDDFREALTVAGCYRRV